MGRDLKLLENFPFILKNLCNKSVICDADFFWFLNQNFEELLAIMKQGKNWIFTPNKKEFQKLLSKLNDSEFDFKLIDQFLDGVDRIFEDPDKKSNVFLLKYFK